MNSAFGTTAAFIGDGGKLHAARYVRRDHVHGQCGATSPSMYDDDSPGVAIYYVPSWAFDGHFRHGDIEVCQRCGEILREPAPP